jgi:hypothetical protein
MILFRAFACRRAANCAAGATGQWSAVIRAVVFDLEMTAGSCFINLCDNRVAVAFVAAGETTYGGAATGCAGRVNIGPMSGRRREFERIDAPHAIFVHFAFRRECVFRRMWPTLIQVYLRRLIVGLGTLYAKARERNGVESG